jgi:hypothetical protein
VEPRLVTGPVFLIRLCETRLVSFLYFRTLQEGLAASKESIVVCGDEEIPWIEVLGAMRSFLVAGNFASTSPIIRLFSEIYTSHQSS